MLIIASSSISLMLPQTITACCQTFARRGWQTSRGCCPDRSATDSWQVPVVMHALLRVRDSAWHYYLCCYTSCPTRKPLSPVAAKLDFPLMVPRGRPVDLYMYICMCMCMCAWKYECMTALGLTPIKADRRWRGRERGRKGEREQGVDLFRVVLTVSGVTKPSPWLALLLTHKECNASFCWMSSSTAVHSLNINSWIHVGV